MHFMSMDFTIADILRPFRALKASIIALKLLAVSYLLPDLFQRLSTPDRRGILFASFTYQISMKFPQKDKSTTERVSVMVASDSSRKWCPHFSYL